MIEHNGLLKQAAQQQLKAQSGLKATNELNAAALQQHVILVAELRKEVAKQDETIRLMSQDLKDMFAKLRKTEEAAEKELTLEKAFPLNREPSGNLQTVGTKSAEGTTRVQVIPQYSFTPPPAPQPWPVTQAEIVSTKKDLPTPQDYA